MNFKTNWMWKCNKAIETKRTSNSKTILVLINKSTSMR